MATIEKNFHRVTDSWNEETPCSNTFLSVYWDLNHSPNKNLTHFNSPEMALAPVYHFLWLPNDYYIFSHALLCLSGGNTLDDLSLLTSSFNFYLPELPWSLCYICSHFFSLLFIRSPFFFFFFFLTLNLGVHSVFFFLTFCLLLVKATTLTEATLISLLKPCTHMTFGTMFSFDNLGCISIGSFHRENLCFFTFNMFQILFITFP